MILTIPLHASNVFPVEEEIYVGEVGGGATVNDHLIEHQQCGGRGGMVGGVEDGAWAGAARTLAPVLLALPAVLADYHTAQAGPEGEGCVTWNAFINMIKKYG